LFSSVEEFERAKQSAPRRHIGVSRPIATRAIFVVVNGISCCSGGVGDQDGHRRSEVSRDAGHQAARFVQGLNVVTVSTVLAISGHGAATYAGFNRGGGVPEEIEILIKRA